MSRPVAPSEWRQALMKGYAITATTQNNYPPHALEAISCIVRLSDIVFRCWNERKQGMTDVEFEENITQEQMEADGNLNALLLLGKIDVEGCDKFPIVLAYKWKEGWCGFMISLHTHL